MEILVFTVVKSGSGHWVGREKNEEDLVEGLKGPWRSGTCSRQRATPDRSEGVGERRDVESRG